MGRGDAKGADQAAVDAMRRAFDGVDIRGTVVIGEGERDEAPMLYIGEKVGAGWHEGSGDSPRSTSPSIRSRAPTCAPPARPTPLAVIAIADDGKFLNAPDTYMDKIAVGPVGQGRHRHHQVADVEPARARRGQERASVEDLTAIILERRATRR